MCLYTDSAVHGSDLKDRKAATATRDILVWKVLADHTAKGGKSPFRGCFWRFGVPRTSVMKKQLFGYQDRIDVGLHAVLSRTGARNLKGDNFYNARVFPAVIPKGSRLYFGQRRDIVATEMIVYPNLAAVEAVHGKVAPKVPKKTLIS